MRDQDEAYLSTSASGDIGVSRSRIKSLGDENGVSCPMDLSSTGDMLKKGTMTKCFSDEDTTLFGVSSHANCSTSKDGTTLFPVSPFQQTCKADVLNDDGTRSFLVG